MNRSQWREAYLQKVAQSSEEGAAAARFVREKNVKVGFRRARKNVAAFWTFARSFYLNKAHFTMESALTDPRAWTLFVHEARHLQQGALTAVSVYGELDAWQYEFRLLKKITGWTLHKDLEELLALPLGYDRAVLRRARALMTKFAGFGYGAWILPLYPVQREIAYWFGRRFE
ncbi:MAG: hypothetical protein LC099_10970 [Anaerolineales bacterium]|nr:hypothetical protein [Anaerolineales bacterium]